jgi:hypothetical protein
MIKNILDSIAVSLAKVPSIPFVEEAQDVVEKKNVPRSSSPKAINIAT